VEDIDFWVKFVDVNSNKLQKLSLKAKISWAINVFTLPNLEIFKIKECVHTWANCTCYNSKYIKAKQIKFAMPKL